MAALGRSLEQGLHAEEEPFLKCTGDGFLACFGSARAAFEAALHVWPETPVWASLSARLSIALHWGSASLTAAGDRIGKDLHVVFALEKLRHAESSLADAIEQPGARQLTVMTERFWRQLDDGHRQQTERLGSFLLKGLNEAQQVFRWTGPATK